MTRQYWFSIVFFALFGLLLYQMGLILQPFVFPALWAALLAHGTFPLHERLSTIFGGNHTLSAAVLTLGALGMVVVPLVLIGVLLVHEAGVAEEVIRAWVENGGLQRLPDQVATIPIIGQRLRTMLSGFDLQRLSLEQSVVSGVAAVSRFLVGRMGDLLKNAVMLVMDFFIMLLVLFFLLRDGRTWLSHLYQLVPMGESHKQTILARLDQTIRAVIKGILVTAVVQGSLAGLAYLVLGIPFPMVLTVLTILLAPLPVGGTALVWGPVALYLLWVGEMGKAMMMLGWGVGVVSVVDHFLRPWLIGQEMQIPVLLLVLSVLGGLALYGVLGIFLGPVLVSLLLTAVQIYREEYQTSEESVPPASPSSS
ncbi:MAG: AI-2E family transporter [Nitrospira sp.]|nr:AI-2E family transporter [Nitrospira sp.]